MKKLILLLLPLLPLLIFIPKPTQASADNCYYNLGTASSGQTVKLDLCTIQRQRDRKVSFNYRLGNETINAQSNCRNNTWTTFPEREIHSPQSSATTDLMKLVCTAPTSNDGIGIGVVFDPPSNIRRFPNGPIVCTIRELTAIELAGGITESGWVRTRACGGGVIYKDQLRFN